MKKLVVCFLLIAALLMVPQTIKADQNPRVFVDGQEVFFDVLPVILEGRVMVPLSKIAHCMSIPVRWDEDKQTVFFYDNCCTLDCEEAWIRNQKVILDVPPIRMDGRILVPLRFVAEATKCSINYDPNANAVYITSIGSEHNTQLDNNVWIYYIDQDGICRQKLDTPKKTVLFKGNYIENMKCINDQLYFRYNPNENWALFRISTQGGTPQEVIPASWLYEINGNYCYYCDDDYNIMRQDLSGKEASVFVEKSASDIKAFKEWIYYVKGGNLYREKEDGSLVQTIYMGSVVSYVMSPSFIFIREGNGGLYKVNLDGTGNTKITNEWPLTMAVSDQWIYFTTNYESGIWRLSFDGINCTKISNDQAIIFGAKNNWVYYEIMENRNTSDILYAIKTDGTCKSKITNHAVKNVVIQ